MSTIFSKNIHRFIYQPFLKQMLDFFHVLLFSLLYGTSTKVLDEIMISEMVLLARLKKILPIILLALLLFSCFIPDTRVTKVFDSWGYSSNKFRNITFFYVDQNQLQTIDSIKKNMDNYMAIAQLFFLPAAKSTSIDVYMKGSELAKKDDRLSKGANGYFDGYIVLRTDELTNELPNGNAVIYAKPDVVNTFYHEYTHHLIRLTSSKKLPQWFEEGLAVYLANKVKSREREIKNILDLRTVSDKTNWSKYPDDLIYYSAEVYVQRIINLWGEEFVRHILDDVSKGIEFTVSIEKATGLTYPEVVKKISENRS